MRAHSAFFFVRFFTLSRRKRSENGLFPWLTRTYFRLTVWYRTLFCIIMPHRAFSLAANSIAYFSLARARTVSSRRFSAFLLSLFIVTDFISFDRSHRGERETRRACIRYTQYILHILLESIDLIGMRQESVHILERSSLPFWMISRREKRFALSLFVESREYMHRLQYFHKDEASKHNNVIVTVYLNVNQIIVYNLLR